jgi:hypothetical protein
MRNSRTMAALGSAICYSAACGGSDAPQRASDVQRPIEARKIISSDSPAAAAQRSTTLVVAGSIASPPACSECGITLTGVVTLGRPSEAELIHRGASPVRDSRGRYYVRGASGAVVVFESTGDRGTVIGQLGDGPGEISCPILQLRIGRGDSLHTFGRCQQLVFSPEHRFVRSVPVPGTVEDVLLLPDGRALLHGTVGTQSAHGYPFHLLASDGGVEKSFGSETGELVPQCQQCFLRRVALSHDSTSVWSVPIHRYRLEAWDLSGTRTQVVSFTRSRWFREWMPVPAVMGAAPPPAPVSSLPNIWTSIEQLVAVDSNSILIRGIEPDPSVSAQLPNGRSVEPVRSMKEARTRRPAPVQWFPSRATVIDVLDLTAGEVVATGKWPGVEIELMDRGYAYSRREDEQGRVLIDIWRIDSGSSRR